VCFLFEQVQLKKGASNPATKTYRPLEDAFGMVKRDGVDLKIMQFIAVNGIPFNVLRSPQYYEMVYAIKQVISSIAFSKNWAIFSPVSK
jgi:hypothetical protein